MGRPGTYRFIIPTTAIAEQGQMAEAMMGLVHPQHRKTAGCAQNTRQILNHHQGVKDREGRGPSSGPTIHQIVFKVDECIFASLPNRCINPCSVGSALTEGPKPAEVVKLVDTHVSGACVARHAGSSPAFGTRPASTGCRLFFVHLFALTVLFFSCFLQATSAQPPGTVRVRGWVKDDQGRGVAYATLVFEPGQITGLSNENGRYEVFLRPGAYTVQVAHLGYRPRRMNWEFPQGSGSVVEGPDLILEPRVVALQEITVKAGKEDPAYAMMRKAIAAAPAHAAGPWRYTAETYVKGQFKIVEVPWILRRQLEQEGLKQGVTYVMESASRIKYRRPRNFEEKVLSRRSNLPKSMEANLNYSNINLYEPQSRDWVSPLSSKAFAHYRFEYLGSEEEEGERLHRIAVRPRGGTSNRYRGTLVLRSKDWSLDRVELVVKNPAGDTFRIGKQYRRIQGFSMQTMEDLQMELSFLGASARIRYISSIRRFDEVLAPPDRLSSVASSPRPVGPSPSLAKTRSSRKKSARVVADSAVADLSMAADVVRKATAGLDSTPGLDSTAGLDAEYRFEVDTAADASSDSLWEMLRTIRLDSAEQKGYAVADSLGAFKKPRSTDDTTRSAASRFFKTMLWGSQSQKGRDAAGQAWQSREWSGWVRPRWTALDLYNPLEGWVVSGTYQRQSRDLQNRNTSWKASLRWGSQLHQVLPALDWSRSTTETRWQWGMGSALEPLSGWQMPRWAHLLSLGMAHPSEQRPWWYTGFEGVLTTKADGGLEQRLSKKWRMWLGAGVEKRSYVMQSADPLLSPMWSSALAGIGSGSSYYSVRPTGSLGDLFREHQRLRMHASWRWEPLTEKRKVNGWVRYRRSSEALVGLDLDAAWVYQQNGVYPWSRVHLFAERNRDLGADRRWNGRIGAGWFSQSPCTFADFYAWPSQAYGWGRERAMAPRGLNPHLLTAQKSWFTLMQEYQTARLSITHWKPLARMRATETICAYLLGESGRMIYGELTWKLSGIAGLVGLELGHQTALFRQGSWELSSKEPAALAPPIRGDWWLLRGGLVRINVALP